MTVTEASMRDAFGAALLDLADEVREMVVLDADVSSSTRTSVFGRAYPNRFFNVGVAEANMIDLAAGMSTCGLRPVVSSFSLFLILKGLDQIRSVVSYNRLPVVMVGGYGGVSGSFEGASHHAIEDLASTRGIPNLAIVVPGDATEVAEALRLALHRDGPTFIRLGRNPSPSLLAGKPALAHGKARTLRTGTDLSIVVCGIPLAMTLAAALELERIGVSAELIQISTLKPLDVETLVASAAKTGAVLTVEEHNVHGGLGSAVAEALVKHCPVWMDFVGVEDHFTESGPYWDLLAKVGLSTQAIVRKAKLLLERAAGAPAAGRVDAQRRASLRVGLEEARR